MSAQATEVIRSISNDLMPHVAIGIHYTLLSSNRFANKYINDQKRTIAGSSSATTRLMKHYVTI